MSGARNCPETPRQKMIGMMYLVLTAMLALNISSSVLEGFTMVDNSLHTTIESANVRNQSQYVDFLEMDKKNPQKVHEWLLKAKDVRTKSDELYNYIEEFKVNIIKLTDRDKANDSAYVKQIIAKDNLDKAGQYGLISGNGQILKKKIENYRNFLVGLSEGNPTKINMYKSIFSTAKSRDGKPWETTMFEMMPVAAVVTVLTKYQSDVRASEAEIVQYLKAQTDATDFRVNKIEALVIPESKYVIRGDRYKAQIVLSAVDSTQKTNYYINGSSVANGKYEASCQTIGQKTYSGQITFLGNDGNLRSKSFRGEYMVGEPSATLSNEDLNVVYRGIDNKFSVSVPGVAAANIRITVEGGSSVQIAPGRYIIRPTRDEEIKISVFAKIDKKELLMGGGYYRVKYLPDPKAFLQSADAGAKPTRGGFMTPGMLKGSSLIASYGGDELVKANFRITSFTMIARGIAPLQVSGGKINPSFIDKLLKGDILMISNIRAEGPDLRPRDLGSVSIQL
jgi:gliding motility-associated protein GldM